MRNNAKPLNRLAYWLLTSATLIMGACGGAGNSSSTPSGNITPKGTRTLALDAYSATSSDPSAGLAAAKAVGATSVTQLITWSMIEPSPNVYSTAVLQPTNTLLPQSGLSLSLMIAVINTSLRDMPSDLNTLAFDDPKVIARFETMLDQVFAAIPNVELVSLGIGNEIDGYLTTSTQWTQYANFYATVSAYARSKRSGLKVGVQGTLYGMLANKAAFQALGNVSDVFLVSYYPLNSDSTVKDPSVVNGDLNNLAAAFSSKPIQIREAGYPTGSVVNSSVDLQASFVNNLFAAWDQQASNIQYLCVTRLKDKTDAEIANDSQYYGITDPRILNFIQTLGLRTSDGTNKPAMSALSTQAHARGW